MFTLCQYYSQVYDMCKCKFTLYGPEAGGSSTDLCCAVFILLASVVDESNGMPHIAFTTSSLATHAVEE